LAYLVVRVGQDARPFLRGGSGIPDSAISGFPA
jgi:hypothetical protein